MGKAIMIVGPTASGKSELALKYAEKLNAEIISADSMQIYKYMDIGTAKTKILNKKIYMTDVIEPTSEYSVGDYIQETSNLLRRFDKENKNIVVVGGTGLYLKGLDEGISNLPTVNKKIRDELETCDLEELQQMLQKRDKYSFVNIDIKNKKRIIRALEVNIATNESFYKLSRQNIKKHNYIFEKVGIFHPREILYERINIRVDKMIKLGLLDEAKYLYDNFNLSKTAKSAIGYKEFYAYFENKCSLKEAIEQIKQNSRRYAKRQITWFKKIEKINWKK